MVDSYNNLMGYRPGTNENARDLDGIDSVGFSPSPNRPVTGAGLSREQVTYERANA